MSPTTLYDFIMEVLKNREGYKGTEFLKDFLKTEKFERVVNGKRVTFPLIDKFKYNCKFSKKNPSTESVWTNINNGTSYGQAFSSAFDWFDTPEGFEYWHDIDKKFNQKLTKAVNEGLKTHEKEVDDRERVIIGGGKSVCLSPETSSMLRFINPFVNCITKGASLFREYLNNHCLLDGYVHNLKCAPKPKGFENVFNEMFRTKNLHDIIFWSFCWDETEEGKDIWEKANKEFNEMLKAVKLSGVDLTHYDYRAEEKESGVSSFFDEEKPNKTIYKNNTPLWGDDDDDDDDDNALVGNCFTNNQVSTTTSSKNNGLPRQCYTCVHGDCYSCDIYGGMDDDYDGLDLFGCGAYGGYGGYGYYTESVPKLITSLPTSSNIVSIVVKEPVEAS